MANTDNNEFIEKINEVYKNSVGYEDFGNTTEFFDEDGCVVMTIQSLPNGRLLFSFGTEESYEFEEKNIEEE